MTSIQKIIALVLSLAFLFFVGSCFQAKPIYRYHEARADLETFNCEIFASLSGTAYTSGEAAVGAPYTLFISINPAVDELKNISLRLVEFDGDITYSLDKVSLIHEKTARSENSFLYYSYTFEKLEYLDYDVELTFFANEEEHTSLLELKRNYMTTRMSNILRRISSI